MRQVDHHEDVIFACHEEVAHAQPPPLLTEVLDVEIDRRESASVAAKVEHARREHPLGGGGDAPELLQLCDELVSTFLADPRLGQAGDDGILVVEEILHLRIGFAESRDETVLPLFHRQLTTAACECLGHERREDDVRGDILSHGDHGIEFRPCRRLPLFRLESGNFPWQFALNLRVCLHQPGTHVTADFDVEAEDSKPVDRNATFGEQANGVLHDRQLDLRAIDFWEHARDQPMSNLDIASRIPRQLCELLGRRLAHALHEVEALLGGQPIAFCQCVERCVGATPAVFAAMDMVREEHGVEQMLGRDTVAMDEYVGVEGGVVYDSHHALESLAIGGLKFLECRLDI